MEGGDVGMRLMAGVTAVVFSLSACGGGGISSCGDLADSSIALLQDVLNDIGSLSLTDIAQADQLQADLEERYAGRASELEAASSELDCGTAEIGQLVAERLDDLEADGPLAELMLGFFREAVQSGDFDFDIGGITGQ